RRAETQHVDVLDSGQLEPRPPRQFGKVWVLIMIAAVVLGVGGGLAWRWQDVVGGMRGLSTPFRSASSSTQSQPQPQQSPAPPAPPRSTKDEARVRTDQGTQAAQGTQGAADVAQRVVLYEEDPEDANGKRLIGSAVWRTEPVSRGANQPSDVMVRA